MSIKVTIRDVAQRAGTSLATVSHAINDRPGMVSRRTRERIQTIAKELGYRPSRRARQMRKQSNLTLAMQVASSAVTGTWRSSFALNMIILRGVSAYAVARGYHVHLLMGEAGREEAELEAQVLRENAVDGVIFMGYAQEQHEEMGQVLGRMKEVGVAAATVSERMGTLGVPVVAINLEPAVMAAVGRMKELGCGRAAYIGSTYKSEHERRGRFELFQRALGDAAMELAAVHSTRDEVDGYLHTEQLLESGPLPDCIVYGADHLAMAGLKALGRRGVRVPEDVRVLGVDHAPYAAEAPVELASLDQRYFDRGQTLAKVLIDQINHPKNPVASRTELDAAFVDGASLGAMCGDLGGEREEGGASPTLRTANSF
jgi:DNA-binding LacI/PurR family transcriptional regulator